jgi:hypothetical protein
MLQAPKVEPKKEKEPLKAVNKSSYDPPSPFPGKK